jgi:hypothetical protein
MIGALAALVTLKRLRCDGRPPHTRILTIYQPADYVSFNDQVYLNPLARMPAPCLFESFIFIILKNLKEKSLD